VFQRIERDSSRAPSRIIAELIRYETMCRFMKSDGYQYRD
jgi:hypothetical protein